MFESSNGDFDIQKVNINGKGDYVITAGLTNNGVLGRTDIKAKIFEADTITVDMFGSVFYRNFRYKMVTHARVFSLSPKFEINDLSGLFISNSLNKFQSYFGYENMCSWEKIKNFSISLPVTSAGEIDFDFMESFIRELEEERIRELAAYLKVSGLDNYKLSKSESEALAHFDALEWKEFSFSEIFNRIEQGRRLKKDDQLPGDIPFVMSGVTNTGVVGYVSNPVSSFPANSITVDIFGNSFYRGYSFGAGDDTGVYWSTEKNYSKEAMLFFTSAMNKALLGKFSYGKKLRSSQSFDIKMYLPVRNGVPDYGAMETFISAVQKLVIKDVVLYADRKIAAAKKVIASCPEQKQTILKSTLEKQETCFGEKISLY